MPLGYGLGWAQGTVNYRGSRFPFEGVILRGKGAHCEVWENFAVSCAKTAESIEMPFGMWTRVGSRKHLLDWGAHWRHLANMIEPSVCGDDAAFLLNYFDHLLLLLLLLLLRPREGCEVLRSACLYVCLSVCPLAYLKNQTSKLHVIFYECYLWPWLGPPLTKMQYVMYFRVCRWRHFYT